MGTLSLDPFLGFRIVLWWQRGVGDQNAHVLILNYGDNGSMYFGSFISATTNKSRQRKVIQNTIYVDLDESTSNTLISECSLCLWGFMHVIHMLWQPMLWLYSHGASLHLWCRKSPEVNAIYIVQKENLDIYF